MIYWKNLKTVLQINLKCPKLTYLKYSSGINDDSYYKEINSEIWGQRINTLTKIQPIQPLKHYGLSGWKPATMISETFHKWSETRNFRLHQNPTRFICNRCINNLLHSPFILINQQIYISIALDTLNNKGPKYWFL